MTIKDEAIAIISTVREAGAVEVSIQENMNGELYPRNVRWPENKGRPDLADLEMLDPGEPPLPENPDERIKETKRRMDELDFGSSS